MAVTPCTRCDKLIDLDYIDGYTEDGEECLCDPCNDDYLEEKEEE